MLRDGNKNGLMVGSSVDRGKLINTSLETFIDTGGKNASNSSTVQSLEESECIRIVGCGLVERGEQLDDDVRVTTDDTLSIELLWC